MNISMEWKASPNIWDESGVAKFTAENGSVLELKLSNFKTAMKMDAFIRNVYELGSFNATTNACTKIMRALDELDERDK